MRRFLVVGCGGSGGATLAYMMDQLRSDLGAVGITQVPAGWQFVHLDVPTAPSPGPDGLGNVRDQGGSYVGTGPQGDSYRVLDNAISQRLAAGGALDGLATWAPRDPSAVHTPLSTGAGQYRALGRMITLSRAAKVREELQRSWDQLFRVETESEMRRLDIPGSGKFDAGESPVVLVVSSMAGGAGASMALDICRILTLVPGVDPRLMGVFMVAPDIFDSLDASAITGVRANALAMLGEIVASQTGAARDHDVAILRALGQQNGEGELVPFARVFPVGRYVGAERTLFGDGSPEAVYRGLGRGLSAMMMSRSATQQFVEWDLTNGGGTAGTREFIGWGNGQWDNLPWGSFGFASLSMGRDRYAEYSAQRLARSCADRLLRGHLQPGNPASDDEQAAAILDSQWPNIVAELQLPSTSGDSVVGPWVTNVVLPRPEVERSAAQIVTTNLRGYVTEQNGVNAGQWVSQVNRTLSERRQALLDAANQQAYAFGYRWHLEFVRRLEAATTRAVAQLGLQYATAMVKRVSQYMQNVVLPGTQDLAKYGPADVAQLPDEVVALLNGLRGTVTSTTEVLAKVMDGSQRTVERQMYASLSSILSTASGSMVREVFDPMIEALNESHTLLRTAANEPVRDLGLARLQTDEYAAWPADADEWVSQRFSEADNEVMLTSSTDFKQRYEVDLPLSVGVSGPGVSQFGEAVARATTDVITGAWVTNDGTRSPADELPMVERTAEWRSRAFVTDPTSGESRISSPARFDVHVRPTELLGRSRRFVGRTGESFDRFCRVSLREFLTGADTPESELARRHQDVVTKFGEAINLARPLASVNEQAMQAIHNTQQMSYRFKFSAVPFKGLRVADDLSSALDEYSRIDGKTKDVLARALTDEAKIQRVDIFGSYPNYSPLAFNSVLEPAARQWLGATPSQRQAFWRMRRSRPLTASLPMHARERRAMVAGWTLGRAIGQVSVPPEPYSQAARVWDGEASTWRDFPNPLLTPPSQFTAAYDWLPAVVESILLAMAQSHEPPVMSSMLPYRALRRIYDSSPEDEVSGVHGLAAQSNLTRWLRTGDTGTGLASAVDGAGPEVSIDQRAAALKNYLGQSRDFAGRHYLPPGARPDVGLPPAEGGGVFSVITVREQASSTPIFRDLASDVYWATTKILDMVDGCAELAGRPEVTAPGPAVTPPGSTVSFEVPQGGTI